MNTSNDSTDAEAKWEECCKCGKKMDPEEHHAYKDYCWPCYDYYLFK